MRPRVVFLYLALVCLLVPAMQAQLNWQASFSGVNTNLNAVTFGNGLWVAVGDAGTIITSPDGQTWTPRASGTGDRLRAVVFGNGLFVATRENLLSPALYSADGAVWQPVALTQPGGAAGSSSAWNAVAFGGGKFLAVGDAATDVMTSVDGINFRMIVSLGGTIPNFNGGAGAITFDRGRFVGCDSAAVISTTDGTSWQQETDIFDVTGKSGICANGSGGIFAVGGLSPLTYSLVLTPPGYNSAHPPIVTSSNGSFVRYVDFSAVCYGRGLWVVVDRGGFIATYDNEFWSSRGVYAQSTEGFRGVAYDGSGRFVAVGSAPASGTALVATSTPGAGPSAYTISELPVAASEAPLRINNAGQVAGTAFTQANGTFAFSITNSIVTNLGLGTPGAQSWASGLSSNGRVAGYVTDATSTKANVYPGFHYPLSSLVGANAPFFSAANGINASGTVVGQMYVGPDDINGQYHAFRVTNAGTLTDFGTFGDSLSFGSVANGINDRGDIIGIAFTTVGFPPGYLFPDIFSGRAFLLPAQQSSPQFVDFGPGYATAFSLNGTGAVTGWATVPDDAFNANHRVAFLYQSGATIALDTHGLLKSVGYGVNSAGNVVGAFDPDPLFGSSVMMGSYLYGRAFLYTNGEMYDLARLTDASGVGWVLTNATGVNDAGQIVGFGSKDGRETAYLATPTAGIPITGTPIVNLSTRMRVETGDNVGIGGFIITGGSKKVLIRAIGPSLANQNVVGPLADPFLQLFDASHLLMQNDNWRDTQQAEIAATGQAPTSDFESAMVVTLPAGAYTAIVRGTGGTSGVALVEILDLDPSGTARLQNISTRAVVQTGDNVMIAGFIVGGHDYKRVMIRAIGPSLTPLGVSGALQDPTLELHDRDFLITSNDNWQDTDAAYLSTTGLAPSDSRESALSWVLQPGAYTVIVRGVSNTTGVGLVEVYEME